MKKSIIAALVGLLVLPGVLAAQNWPSSRFNNLTVDGNLTLPSKPATNVFAAPSGLAGVPTFRPLAGADIPQINLGIAGNGGVGGILPGSNVNGTSATVTQGLNPWINYATQIGKVPGCVGDGIADDTACLQAAIDARPKGTLYLGNGIYKVTGPITVTAGTSVIGNGGGGGQYDFTCDVGIRVAAAAIDAINLGAGSKLMNTCIDYSVTPTAGAAVKAGSFANSAVIADVQINKAFWGIEVTGNGGDQNVNTVIRNNVITPRYVANGAGIILGRASTNASTVDIVVTDNVIYCYDGAAGGVSDADGMFLMDTGGVLVSGNAIFGCKNGTVISPGNGQHATWNYFTGTVVGDTSKSYDLLINTTHSTAQIRGNQFTGSWTSGGALASIIVANDAGGIVTDTHFAGHRTFFSSTTAGVIFKAGSGSSMDASVVCATSTNAGKGVSIEGTATNSAVRNSTIGVCGNSIAGTLATGVSVTTSSGSQIGSIVGNNIISTTTPIAYTPSTGNNSHAVISENVGIDAQGVGVTGGATVTFPPNRFIVINGPATVTTINGAWAGREVTISNNGTITYNTGGNICNSISGASGTLTVALYDVTTSCWRLK